MVLDPWLWCVRLDRTQPIGGVAGETKPRRSASLGLMMAHMRPPYFLSRADRRVATKATNGTGLRLLPQKAYLDRFSTSTYAAAGIACCRSSSWLRGCGRVFQPAPRERLPSQCSVWIRVLNLRKDVE
jgi:hypothetical protein